MKATLHLEKSPSGLFHSYPTFSTKDRFTNYLLQSKKQLVEFAKFSYLAIVLILLLCAVVELKHIYNVDIFPGIDTPFDNAYFAGKGAIDNSLL